MELKYNNTDYDFDNFKLLIVLNGIEIILYRS